MLRWIRRIDEAVFAIERASVALVLSLITLMMFLDVVHRRVTAPDSKLGDVLARLFWVQDPSARQWIDDNLATPVGAVLSFGLLAFAFRTAEGRRGAPSSGSPMRRRALPWLFAATVVLGAWAFAWALETLASSTVYAALFIAAGIAYVVVQARLQAPGWVGRAVTGSVLAALLVLVSLTYLPEGYFWSKKVSLMLLLWVGFLGASICAHEGKHIRIEALGRLVPDGAKRYFAAAGFLITAVFCGLLCALGFYTVFEPTPSTDPADPEMITLFGTRYVFGYTGAFGQGAMIEGTSIPSWIAIVAIPVAFGLTMLRYLGATVSHLMGGTYGAQAPEEGLEEAREASEAKAPAAGDDGPAPGGEGGAAVGEGGVAAGEPS